MLMMMMIMVVIVLVCAGQVARHGAGVSRGGGGGEEGDDADGDDDGPGCTRRDCENNRTRANMAEGATDARHVMHIATSVKDIQGLSCRPSTCPRTSHRISAQGQSEGPSSVQRHPASSAYPRAASAPNCKFESLSTPERFVTELNTHPPIHPATRQFHLIIRFFIAFRPLTCQP